MTAGLSGTETSVDMITCMSVHYVHICNTTEARSGYWFPRKHHYRPYEKSCECWELNLDSWKEQPILLPTELSTAVALRNHISNKVQFFVSVELREERGGQNRGQVKSPWDHVFGIRQ